MLIVTFFDKLTGVPRLWYARLDCPKALRMKLTNKKKHDMLHAEQTGSETRLRGEANV